ncbi:MAG: isoamylase early set domain-containing protein [Nitrospira sp.]|nr:isoamylase early set domain-containing protein [Nitrospira sp.]
MTSGLKIAMWSVALVLAMSACAPTLKPDMPRPVTGGVRFTYLAPAATTVYVVGSFNGWVKGATSMKREGQTGIWIAEVMLRPGEHTFMYLVDGKEWVVPPLAEDFVTDGFGQTNGVVIVR